MKMGLTVVFQAARMYTQNCSALDLSQIYGVTSMTMG